MSEKDKKYVFIKRQPNDMGIAKVLFENLQEVHWDNISGGIHAKSGQDILYGYIYCDQIIEGEIGHSCAHGNFPHYIKVFIPMKYNDKDIIKELKEIADRNSTRRIQQRNFIVADKVRDIVGKNPGITPSEIYQNIPDCSKDKINNAIHYLKKHTFNTKKSLISEKYKNTQKLYIRN